MKMVSWEKKGHKWQLKSTAVEEKDKSRSKRAASGEKTRGRKETALAVNEVTTVLHCPTSWEGLRGIWEVYRGRWKGLRGIWEGLSGIWEGFRGRWKRAIVEEKIDCTGSSSASVLL